MSKRQRVDSLDDDEHEMKYDTLLSMLKKGEEEEELEEEEFEEEEEIEEELEEEEAVDEQSLQEETQRRDEFVDTTLVDEEEEEMETDLEAFAQGDPFAGYFGTSTHEDMDFEAEMKKQRPFKPVQSLGSVRVHADVASLAQPPTSLDAAYIKKKLQDPWKSAIEDGKLGDVDPHASPFVSNEQQSLASFMFSHVDALICGKQSKREDLLQILALHILNHVYKTRAVIQKNNEKLVADSDLDLRDQAFTRPKILIIAPFRSIAFNLMCILLDILPSQIAQVANKSRFFEEFGPPDGDAPNERKPDDFNETFAGNIDDCFRLGVQFTRKAVKLYTEFYRSDIVVASPVGLRVVIDERGGGDFLSGIEVCVVLRADVLAMQNWEHVRVVMETLNNVPKTSHDVDFGRIRRRWLDGHGSLFRQTIIQSDLLSPELNSIYSRLCHNMRGRYKLRPVEQGVLPHIMAKVQQVFQRVPCDAHDKQGEMRLSYLKDNVIAALKRDVTRRGVFVFVPSYFEYLELRKMLVSDDVVAAHLNEYCSMKDVNRDRRRFYQDRDTLNGCRLMVYTERFHYFHRFRVRGIQHAIFLAPPTNPLFYSEILNIVEASTSQCLTLYTRYDALALERIVGTQRVGKMVKEDEATTFLFT